MKNAHVKVLEETVSLQNKTICDMSIYRVYDIRYILSYLSLGGHVWINELYFNTFSFGTTQVYNLLGID